jgi:hypothetical protein
MVTLQKDKKNVYVNSDMVFVMLVSFKFFGFAISRIWWYLMKVIPETRDLH